MSLLNRLKTIFNPTAPAKGDLIPEKRLFQAAQFNRITADWLGTTSINGDLQVGLAALRRRARELAANNEYARRYLKIIKTNVIGPDGVVITPRATIGPKGDLDPMNGAIERHWLKWTRRENCDVSGRHDWVKLQNLILECVARDGEALIWLRRGSQFGPYAFQLQVLDADHLDENYYGQSEAGNTIFQGVEVDQYGKFVALHVWQHNPADTILLSVQRQNMRLRVPIEDIIHVADAERSSQVRGYPWMTCAMLGLQHIGKYREAELINARVASSKQLFYKQDENVPFANDDEPDDQGNITFEANPGSHEILPRGWSIEKVDWSGQIEKLGDFQKSVLRGIAAGLGISYNSLASDLESVNYSSARFGGLEDQAQFKTLQSWFISIVVQPVYEEWLKMQMLTNKWGLNIPLDRFDKFASSTTYTPRSWQSVDPVKDTRADIALLENSLTSWSAVITKYGKDPDEVFKQIKADRDKMKAMDITPLDIVQQLAQIEAKPAGEGFPTPKSDGGKV